MPDRIIARLLLVAVTLTASALGQTTWFVDVSSESCPGSGTFEDPFCRIQDAIGTATSGDTILVAPGIYSESLDYLGKDVFVLGTEGSGSTILDPGGSARGVIFQSGESRTAVLDGFTVRNGGGVERGGGIYCDLASPTIRNCRIEDCTASSRGGGIALKDSFARIVDTTIARNSAGRAASISDGGGLWIQGATPRIERCDIRDKVAEIRGGGVYCVNSSVVLLSNTIASNRVGVPDQLAGTGGGLHILNGSPTVEENRVEDNLIEGTGASGGGVYWRSPDARLTQNLIRGNRALALGAGEPSTRAQGGGVLVIGGGTLIANTISGNEASSTSAMRAYTRGGGLCFYGTALSLTGDEISANKAYANGSGYSSSAYCYGAGLFTLGRSETSGLRLQENYGVGSGGHGVARGGGGFLNGTTSIVSSRILQNHVRGVDAITGGGRGGGLFSQGNATISNSTIASNRATGAAGVYGIFSVAGGVQATTLKLIHSTVAHNENLIETSPYPDNTLGGALIEDGEVVDSIFWGNGPTNLTVRSGTVSHSDVEGGYAGIGNIGADPRFLDVAALDFRLACDSPCIDAGILLPETPAVDVEGDRRTVDGNTDGFEEPDIGADEFDMLWHLRVDPDSRVFDFEAQAPPAQIGNNALVFISLSDGPGIPVPGSGGRSLALAADGLFTAWLQHPAALRTASITGCPGGLTSPGVLPSAASGRRLFYAGVSFDGGSNIVSVTPTRSVVLP